MGLPSLSQDRVEAPNDRYAHLVEAQAVITAPLSLPLPGGCLTSNATNKSILHDWWSDYKAREPMEHDQASGLSNGGWPWMTNWDTDVNCQADGTSATSIAPPFVQMNNQARHPRLNYDEETAIMPWLSQEYFFPSGSGSMQSFQCPPELVEATSSNLASQMRRICPVTTLPCAENDGKTEISTRCGPQQGSAQSCRRGTSADRRDALLMQARLAGMDLQADQGGRGIR